MKAEVKRALFWILWMTSMTMAIATFAAESPPLSMFALPSAQLRKSAEVTEPKAVTQPIASALATDLSVESSESARETPLELSIQRYEAMNGITLLMKPEFHAEPGGLAGFIETKVLSPIVTPEVVQLRKVKLTGGIVGAIKKKNPFYLLSPLVFAIDW